LDPLDPRELLCREPRLPVAIAREEVGRDDLEVPRFPVAAEAAVERQMADVLQRVVFAAIGPDDCPGLAAVAGHLNRGQVLGRGDVQRLVILAAPRRWPRLLLERTVQQLDELTLYDRVIAERPLLGRDRVGRAGAKAVDRGRLGGV